MKTNIQSTRKHEQGFTLVELSIVLVIIGLIVGGVLVGQDMIRAAEIRATVAQMEEFNSAANTFRDKYNNYPGDMLAVDATSFGFPVRDGTAGEGDGDRLMEGCANANNLLFGCESKLFWRDLNQAGFIKGSTTTGNSCLGGAGAVTNGTACTSAITSADAMLFMPEAEIGLGHYITVYSATGRNWFEIARVTAVSTAGAYTLENAMTPQTAFQLDEKIDDGLPLTGIARAAASTTALDARVAATQTTSAVGDCMAGDATTTDTDDPYNTSTDDRANAPACQLVVRTSF